MLRAFLGPDWRPRRVCFAHDAPADRSVHERVFGRNVEFGHDFNGIVCAARDLEVPNPERRSRDRAARAADARSGLRDADAPDMTHARARAGRDAAGHGNVHDRPGRAAPGRRPAHDPPPPRTARARPSPGLVDAVRRELAERYLKDRHRSLAEVSSLLGFSAPSGFSRWYRQHFKAKPSAHRARVARRRSNRRRGRPHIAHATSTRSAGRGLPLTAPSPCPCRAQDLELRAQPCAALDRGSTAAFDEIGPTRLRAAVRARQLDELFSGLYRSHRLQGT